MRFRADDPKLANALNVRVLARENGVRGAATVPVLAHTGSMFDQAQGMQMLLAECTGKLGLSRAARYEWVGVPLGGKREKARACVGGSRGGG